MTLAIDASIALAWLFRNERGGAHDALRRVVEEGAVVPSLWRLEVANGLRTAVRRQRCDQRYATRCLQRLERLRIAIDRETDAHAWGRTRQLSADYDLTIYDAAYLELALRRRLSLASRDDDLVQAAQKPGVTVLGAA